MGLVQLSLRHRLAILLALAAPCVVSRAVADGHGASLGSAQLSRVAEAPTEALSAAVTRDTPSPTVAPEAGETPAESFNVHTGGGVLFGHLPKPVVAGFAGIDMAIFDGSMFVSVSAMLSAQTRSQLVTGQFEAQLVAGRGAMCHRADAGGGVTLNFCTGVAIGRYLARGSGYVVNRRVNLPWSAGFSHTGLRFLDGPLALELGFEGYLNVVRPSLTVDGAIDDPLAMPFIAWSSVLELLLVF